MKLKAPAFALKRSAQGVLQFSGNGELLAQVTSRVVVWSVSERKVFCSIKAISNEHFVAFHDESQRMAIKNSNGELVFVELPSGDVISQTGRFKEFRMGCQPWFLEGGDLLLDGGSSGALTIWRVSDAKPVEQIDLTCAGVGDIAYSPSACLFACLCGKLGVCEIALIDSDLLPRKFTASDFGVDPCEWWETGHLTFSPCGTRLAFTAKTQARENRSRLFILDLQSTALISTLEIGDDSHGWPASLSWSDDDNLALTFRENPWRQGMSTAQYEEVKKARDWESVHILDVANARFTEKVYVPGINRVAFRPGSTGLALNCAESPGAYLSSSRDISGFAASKKNAASRDKDSAIQ